MYAFGPPLLFIRLPSSSLVQTPLGLEALCHALHLHRNMENIEYVFFFDIVAPSFSLL